MAVRKRLGEMLIEAGIIDDIQLHSALGHQRRWGGKLGQALIDLRLATESQIVAALSRKFGYEVADVSRLEHSPALDSALRLVPGELAVRQVVLPIAADTNTLTVAMGDPSNIASVDELSFRTGRRIKVMIAGEREVAAAARRLYFDEVEAVPLAPIPGDDKSSDLALEVPVDPFAVAPEHAGHGRRAAGAAPSDPFERARPPAPTGTPRPAAAPPPLPGRAVRDVQPVQPAFTPPPVLIPLGSEARPGGPDPFAKPVPGARSRPVEGGERGGANAPNANAAILDAIQRLARGEETSLVKPARLAAVLAQLLVKYGLIDEAEILEELAKDQGRDPSP
jgi:hypothetical protein